MEAASSAAERSFGMRYLNGQMVLGVDSSPRLRYKSNPQGRHPGRPLMRSERHSSPH